MIDDQYKAELIDQLDNKNIDFDYLIKKYHEHKTELKITKRHMKEVIKPEHKRYIDRTYKFFVALYNGKIDKARSIFKRTEKLYKAVEHHCMNYETFLGLIDSDPNKALAMAFETLVFAGYLGRINKRIERDKGELNVYRTR